LKILHKVELCDFHFSPCIIRMIKNKNERSWVCSTHEGKERYIQDFGGEELRERDHLGDLGVDVRIILKWISKKVDGLAWTGLIWLRIGTNCGFL